MSRRYTLLKLFIHFVQNSGFTGMNFTPANLVTEP